MASLSAIRTAIKATIESAITSLRVYDKVPDAAHVLPCVVVQPAAGETADFAVSMGRGTDTWRFDLHVLAPASADGEVAQAGLDPYVTGAGSFSIRQAIFNARTLGLSGVDAHVAGVTGYGFRFESTQIEHVGATLNLVVHTPGTE